MSPRLGTEKPLSAIEMLQKKSAVFVARRAKMGAGKNVQKHGFWGLLIFVMMPIPGTGAYAGIIAAFLFGFKKKKAF